MTQETGAAQKRYLIAVHGAFRARFTPLMDQFRDWLAQSGSPLRGRLDFIRTGETTRPDFAGDGAILFFLADPLKTLYPDCYAEARDWRDAARAAGWRILNDPDALDNTAKARQSMLWRAAGVPHPQTICADDPETLAQSAGALRFPMIIRASNSHAQDTMRLCEDRAALARAAAETPFPAIASEIADIRAEWRRADPSALLARYHHKKRVMVFGDIVMPHHLFLSEHVIVGGRTCTLNAEHGPRAALKRLATFNRRRFDESVKADLDYAFGPAEAPAIMRRAMDALGLDVAAIDYATRPDGAIILWEANPFFALPPEPLYPLPRVRRLRFRMGRIFVALAQAILNAGAAQPEDQRSDQLDAERFK